MQPERNNELRQQQQHWVHHVTRSLSELKRVLKLFESPEHLGPQVPWKGQLLGGPASTILSLLARQSSVRSGTCCTGVHTFALSKHLMADAAALMLRILIALVRHKVKLQLLTSLPIL